MLQKALNSLQTRKGLSLDRLNFQWTTWWTCLV